jgi:hypothetical protein
MLSIYQIIKSIERQDEWQIIGKDSGESGVGLIGVLS